MNWKQEAVNDLRNYGRRKEALKNIRQRIAALEIDYKTIKGLSSDSTPVMGGGNRNEDRMLDNIVKRERLRLNYEATQQLVDLAEKGISGLDERERMVLQRMYIYGIRGAVGSLMDDLRVEKRQIYNIKDRALYKFTITMFGIADL